MSILCIFHVQTHTYIHTLYTIAAKLRFHPLVVFIDTADVLLMWMCEQKVKIHTYIHISLTHNGTRLGVRKTRAKISQQFFSIRLANFEEARQRQRQRSNVCIHTHMQLLICPFYQIQIIYYEIND